MELVDITLSGFCLFREPERVDLSDITLMAVVGANHNGKTSLLRGIEYALYGPTRGSAPGLLNWDSTRMEVTLRVRHDGAVFTITRSHRAKGTGHKLTVTSEVAGAVRNHTGRDLDTTQEFIDQLVGMDRELSRATWMAMQSDVESLGRMDGPARRSVFVRVFGLEAYAPLYEQANAHRKQAIAEVQRLGGMVQALEGGVDADAELAGLDDEALAQQVRDVEAHARRVLWQEGWDYALSEFEALRDEDGADEASEDGQQADTELAGALEREKQLTVQMLAMRTTLATARQERTAARDACAAIEARIELLSATHEASCTTCGQSLDQQARAHVEATFADELARAEKSFDEADERCAAAGARLAETEAALSTATAEVAEARRAVARAASARVRRDERTKRLVRAQQRLDELGSTEPEQVAEPAWTLERLHAEQHVRELNRRNAARLEAARAELEAAQASAGNWEALAAAFAPSGIPMRILSQVCADVAHDANRILALMLSPLRITLDASGTGVDVRINRADWSSLSGQEGFYCGVALRLALVLSIERRTGCRVSTLLLDEGWGVLDESHAQRAVEAFMALSNRFGTLTVIHSEQVAAQMPQRMEVDASSGTSRVVRVG